MCYENAKVNLIKKGTKIFVYGVKYFYEEDIQNAKEAFEKWQAAKAAEIIARIPRVDRSPSVVLKELADSSVNLSVKAWTRNATYWSVLYDINERIYKELPTHGINFPFPQMDIHISREDN